MELNYFMKQLKSYRRILTKQEYCTFKGQALSGDLVGAKKGLARLIERKSADR